MNEFKHEKMTKYEWEMIEKPLNKNETDILNLIKKGFNAIDIKVYKYSTIKQLINISGENSDYYIFNIIILPYINDKYKKYIKNIYSIKEPKKKINNKDKIKLSNIKICKDCIEYIIIENIKNLIKYNLLIYFYNIHYLIKVYKINESLLTIITPILNNYTFTSKDILIDSENVIEKNEIFNYNPIQLFDHQKELFNKITKYDSSFIFYTASTCSGKTLTPIGLTNKYKIIFICASRHIGINLSKSAINVGCKVGFSFGCESKNDIRLHYFSVVNYVKKIPNHTNGSNVEIMISDIHSYQYAMEYMLEFNDEKNIILFWDEPTITMDYDDHPLHSSLKYIWNINKISKIIFSSATLPKNLDPLVRSYQNKFKDGHHFKVESFDEITNIKLIDSYSNIVMPHNIFNSIDECNQFIEGYSKEFMKFLSVTECSKYILGSSYLIEFEKIKFTTVNSIKIKDFYFYILSKELNKNIFKTNLSSNILFTTESAKEIKYGPALYINNDIEDYIKELIESSHLNVNVHNEISKNIDFNYELQVKINKVRQILEDKLAKDINNENKMKEQRFDPVTKENIKKIEKMEKMEKKIQLCDIYIPNTKEHYTKWGNKNDYNSSNVYKGNIEEKYIRLIMNLDVEENYKILLLLGIGIFHKNNNVYNIIMKELADNKQLMLIISNSDYIYGTNYQFAHGYLSSDIENITKEKLIQAIGRVGRKEKNKLFTFRFRNNDHIKLLFEHKVSKEGIKMNSLFC